MSKKVTFKTLWNVLEEIKRGATDKSRTTSNVSDIQIRKIVEKGTEIGISSGFAKGIGLAAVGATAGAAALGTGTGAIASGGATALGVAAFSAKAGAATGAAAGSAVPVVGTIIGAGVGLLAGVLVGWLFANKNKNEKQRLNQEVLAQQNGIIKQLIKEKEELEKGHNRTQQQIERYKYIIGLLMGNNDLMNICAA